MAVQARFCGRCGAMLNPQSPFCGRCGAPVVALTAVAQPASYAYPMAPAPARARGAGRGAQVAVAVGLLLVLSVVTVAVSAFAASKVIGSHPTCLVNCGAKFVSPLTEAHTYKSASFGFEVDYFSSWKLRTQDSAHVTLGTRAGLLQVTGSRASDQPDIVLLNTVAALPNSEWQSVARVSDLKGAHLGDQDGIGAVYSANLVGSNAKAVKVRFAIVVATRGNVTVVFFAVNPSDPKNYPHGIPEGQAFDYVCQEFRWGS
jgi:hypothetical protein